MYIHVHVHVYVVLGNTLVQDDTFVPEIEHANAIIYMYIHVHV